ncbi:RNA-binding protein Cwf29 [Cryptotrichosporon argae]
MNSVAEINRINQRELELGVKGSWHDEYKDSAYIFVGGLSFDLTEGDVITVFSQWGELADINMPRDAETGKPRGFAFLMYVDQRSTVLAVDNMNGAQVVGRTIRVDHCREYRQQGKKNAEGEYVAPDAPTYNALPPELDPSDSESSAGSAPNLDEEDPMAAYLKTQRRIKGEPRDGDGEGAGEGEGAAGGKRKRDEGDKEARRRRKDERARIREERRRRKEGGREASGGRDGPGGRDAREGKDRRDGRVKRGDSEARLAGTGARPLRPRESASPVRVKEERREYTREARDGARSDGRGDERRNVGEHRDARGDRDEAHQRLRYDDRDGQGRRDDAYARRDRDARDRDARRGRPLERDVRDGPRPSARSDGAPPQTHGQSRSPLPRPAWDDAAQMAEYMRDADARAYERKKAEMEAQGQRVSIPEWVGEWRADKDRREGRGSEAGCERRGRD